ncbi:MAG TPA: hypothetical protein VFJ14_03955 [Nocardioidaceae bacterium]|nr:hypothetical protein [Nocardioidaceae bacterium]
MPTTTPQARPGTATQRPPRTSLRGAVAGPAVELCGMAWLTAVLLIDAEAGAWTQRGLGLVTWAVLLLVLWRESALVRVQTAVVVAFATAVEYTFSPWLEVYVYRLDNVPLYVPPGHGLVYLAALALGRAGWVQARRRLLAVAVTVVGAAWAAHGLWWAERPDALGAFWFCCLAAFLAWGPSPGLYIGAFAVVSYLEILGTALGIWTWQPVGPTGSISIGNPPSGAAGGYAWFDLAALLLAPRLLACLARLRSR